MSRSFGAWRQHHFRVKKEYIVFNSNFMYNPRIMNSEAFIDDFVCRPKINRLPPSITSRQAVDKRSVDPNFVKWLFLALVFGALLSAITSYRAFYSDDARLLEVISSTDDVVKPKESSIYLRSDDGVIAGQMVKMAPDSEKAVTAQGTDTGPKNDDASTQRELMGILTKY